MIMSDEKEVAELTPEQLAKVEELKAKMLADAGDGDDDPTSSKTSSENRFQKLANANKELKGTVDNLQQVIAQMKADNEKASEERLTKKGDLKSIIATKDGKISDLETALTEAQLGVERLMVGREQGLPDSISILLNGTDKDSITAQAMKLVADMPKPKGFSDVNRNQSQTSPSKPDAQTTLGDYNQQLKNSF